jgi:hypothetical protein
LQIFKNFAASAAARLHLFLIGGGGSEIFKTFAVSAAAAPKFLKLSPSRRRRLSRSAYTSNHDTEQNHVKK